MHTRLPASYHRRLVGEQYDLAASSVEDLAGFVSDAYITAMHAQEYIEKALGEIENAGDEAPSAWEDLAGTAEELKDALHALMEKADQLADGLKTKVG